ncbi:MAG: 1-acyl-sn-glycerol-3-phosphate acyltransferase [Candidatus Pelagisphaera sp.]|jgi:1-acyl-sn-glycerol-3-phosphate acyltransferase
MPPKYSRAFRPVLHALTRLSLRFEHKVSDVRIVGQEGLERLIRDGQSIMVAPNHADHADPALMITAGRRSDFAFHFMAAREGFERNWFHQFVLQRGGAFSVNREGGDIASIKMAIKVLQEARFPLVIFPEGEIYHHKESLDELNEGVASIALRAASKLPEGRRGFVVPASITLKHDASVQATFSERLNALEKSVSLEPRVGANPVERIFDFGSAFLSMKEKELLGESRKGELVERLQYLRQTIVSDVESQRGMSNGELTIPKRIKALRAVVRKELTQKAEDLSSERIHELYDQLDRVYMAHQLYSYPGTYLSEDPSIDRIAETIFKLEEDVLGKACHLGKRKAEIRFDDPIDLAEFLAENQLNSKTGVDPLTRLIRDRIQRLITK